MIELKKVVKDYTIGDSVYRALRSISFAIDEGEFSAIIGPSGCGKTTTMNILGLLDKPTSGTYYLFGENTLHYPRNQQADYRNQFIGFVFQSFLLLPRLTAIQNVGLPLIYRRQKSKDIKNQSIEMLERVGMKDFMDHHPYELSGGQQQRVAIARALVGKPKLLLADEPTGALDSQTSDVVMALLKEIHDQQGVTVVIITHDPEVADQCGRILSIRDGQLRED